LIVLDCSVALAWLFEDEQTAGSLTALDELQNSGALVPQHFLLEIANVLWVAERRDRITQADAGRFLDLVCDLPIAIDNETLDYLQASTIPLARRCRLSPDDAAYVELAGRRGLPILTGDEAMIRAAVAEGVPVIRG